MMGEGRGRRNICKPNNILRIGEPRGNVYNIGTNMYIFGNPYLQSVQTYTHIDIDC